MVTSLHNLRRPHNTRITLGGSKDDEERTNGSELYPSQYEKSTLTTVGQKKQAKQSVDVDLISHKEGSQRENYPLDINLLPLQGLPDKKPHVIQYLIKK